MASSNQQTTALLTEHFRYTPLTLLDDIINTVNELVFRAINAIEEGLATPTPQALGFKDAPAHQALLQTAKSSEERERMLREIMTNEIDAGIVKLESLLNATVDRDFDKFEIYTLRNILAVGHEEDGLAEWVQLDHYKGLHLEGEGQGQSTVKPEEVQMQRRKLHETQKLNAMLSAEEIKNAAVLAQLQGLVGTSSGGQVQHNSADLGFLTQGKPVTAEGVQYALAQLPALRQLLDQLKRGLQTMPSARRAEDDGSVDAKRRRYIDSQSRRALERRGVNIGDGSVEAAVAGRRIGKEEVEGLEAIVQAMGGAERPS